MRMDFSEARIHCSVLGYLMIEGRTKSNKKLYEEAQAKLTEWQQKWDAMDERQQGMAKGKAAAEKIEHFKQKKEELEPVKDHQPLSQTAKSFLKRYYAKLKYGKWSASLDKGNKYTSKGKLAEPDSIELISFLDKIPLKKNDTRLQNHYITGEIDVFVGSDILEAEYIYDVKTSWDVETFFSNLGKSLYSLYWWQMQGYLALSGALCGEISYCLVNTPASILEEEKYRLFRRMDVVSEDHPDYKKAEAEMINNMTFNDIPAEDRRIKFKVKRDEEAIAKIWEKVEMAREYLEEIQKLHEQREFDAIQYDEVLDESEEEVSFESN